MRNTPPDETKVWRGGYLVKIKASELVPGDIIEATVGDKIPADARLLKIHSSTFRIDQALLTGESISVNKDTAVVEDLRAVLQDQTNIVFSVIIYSLKFFLIDANTRNSCFVEFM